MSLHKCIHFPVLTFPSLVSCHYSILPNRCLHLYNTSSLLHVFCPQVLRFPHSTLHWSIGYSCEIRVLCDLWRALRVQHHYLDSCTLLRHGRRHSANSLCIIGHLCRCMYLCHSFCFMRSLHRKYYLAILKCLYPIVYLKS